VGRNGFCSYGFFIVFVENEIDQKIKMLIDGFWLISFFENMKI